MRAAATLLLALMASIFVAASVYHGAHPALPWVRAFAEAAMVGGLADWFAVTALFRHPMGLPIPHTAIIPANKDRIGDSLAQFLKENFLTPAVVARRLETADLAGIVASALQADRSTGKRRRGLGPLLARLIEALDDKAVGDLVRDTATSRLKAMALSPIVADAVDTTLAKGRHEPIIDAALDWGLKTLSSEEPTIRGMVADRTNWFLRLVNVDESVSDSLIGSVQRLLVEVKHDPYHPLRQRLHDSLKTWAFDLRHFPESQEKVEGFKDDLIANPAMGTLLSGLWGEARDALVRSLNDPASAEADRLGPAMKALGARLDSDANLSHAVNLALRRAIVGLAHDYGDAIVALVSDTVRGWDASTVTEKVENAVGRDLQFIRINGTIIGGLIGIAMHGIALGLRARGVVP
ncbi:DUF445 domain-containing protein [Sandarakinorhabdus sp.]|uniref:DUF445 domain-containing protein n=1 Tax=Sandarakinorhabdus sp. TaxID=1916663 RepID=UPI00286E8F57|nr:DUF445 domain-containing protein [Sandarakinorhabdus sp.]